MNTNMPQNLGTNKEAPGKIIGKAIAIPAMIRLYKL